MKISVIGAGSSYTPELVQKIIEKRDTLPIKKVTLMDIDEKRLDIIFGYFKRVTAKAELDIEITATTDRREAIIGSDFVITQIRVGGNQARAQDSRIPLKYDCIGQETTGPGGFANGLRTIPVMVEIANEVAELAPDAWIVNYANPTGLIAEAVQKYTKAKIVGLCSGTIQAGEYISRALNVPMESVYYDFFGLNHLNFAYNIKIDGKPLADGEFDKIAETSKLESELVKTLGVWPITYLQYYFCTRDRLAKQKSKDKVRAEVIMELEKELFAVYADESVTSRPDILNKRGGDGYSDMAFGFIDATWNNNTKWLIVNTQNNGAYRYLPDDAVIEVPCMINKAGVHPLAVNEVPKMIWGLVASVKNYEQLTVEAAMTGDKTTALYALMAHPLVRDFEVAKGLLGDLLEANKKYLPNFFKD